MKDIFKKLLENKTVLLDGSTGTMLQRYGMPGGVSPEMFCIQNPSIIERIQREYIEAGSDILLTPTFGANRVKLKNYGQEKQTRDINAKLTEMTLKTARTKNRLVAGDIGPTGIFFQPFGESTLDEGLEIFSEQMQALEQAGANLLVIETQIDIQEARIALLAAKACTHLPVLVSMTFDESQRTLTGSDPLTCLNILQSLGADGFGINCSSGPDKIIEIIKSISTYATIPLFVKPNAGLPYIQDEKTIFPMAPREFAAYAPLFWEQGVSLLGGCCGTTPDHIAGVREALTGKGVFKKIAAPKNMILSSARKSLFVHQEKTGPLRVIGERINPTGKTTLQADLKAGKMEQLKNLADEQSRQGADLLDVNVGMPGIDERETMLKALAALSLSTDLPLCIDSSKPEVIEAALRFYPGRALVNSLSGEKEKLKTLIPLIKKYGAAFIVLPLDDCGIPETFADRVAVLERIFSECQQAGVDRTDAVVDGLVMTVSANQKHAGVTLATLRYVSETLRLNTVVGLSNVSFGLPGREFINSAFAAMAAEAGLSMVIANPSAPQFMSIKAGAEVLTGRDQNSRQYIEFMQQHAANNKKTETPMGARELQPEQAIAECVLKGEKEKIEKYLQLVLKQGLSAFEIVQKIMVPAIQQVGEKFNRREYFLPQLIASAETMEKGVQFLSPFMSGQERKNKGVGVIATVKGDIHDIGKKIVILLLQNHGYQIIDLGKAVDEETIVNKAIEHKADFIGLSALMTTTMIEMKKVIDLLKKKQLPIRVIVGGAVVTQKYADEIGADGYALDAGKCVEVVNQWFSKR